MPWVSTCRLQASLPRAPTRPPGCGLFIVGRRLGLPQDHVPGTGYGDWLVDYHHLKWLEPMKGYPHDSSHWDDDNHNYQPHTTRGGVQSPEGWVHRRLLGPTPFVDVTPQALIHSLPVALEVCGRQTPTRGGLPGRGSHVGSDRGSGESHDQQDGPHREGRHQGQAERNRDHMW